MMNEHKQARVLLWLMLFMWLTCSLLAGEYVYRGVSSLKWTKTTGITVNANPDAKSTTSVGIRYEYIASGSILQGSRRAFKLSGQSNAILAEGSKITVYIHPKSPKVSVLETGTDGLSVSLLITSLLATVLSALGLRKISKG
ncbi:MAG: hypothetical protein K0Q55_488 [Verrucomicrobia bacterium]|jgi:hypothetical protein|nr:hypothetical protein [Verrucomicrobiota bacterium]